MANLLTLRISEEKYRTAISQLGDKIVQLQDNLGKLQGKRTEIENNYRGPQAEKAIETIKEDEAQVQKAIDNVKAQRDKIQAYLDSMSQKDTEIQANYSSAKEAAKNVFA